MLNGIISHIRRSVKRILIISRNSLRGGFVIFFGKISAKAKSAVYFNFSVDKCGGLSYTVYEVIIYGKGDFEMSCINVTVWNEFRHEKHNEAIKKIYPNGIHNTIKDYLDKVDGLKVRTATLDEPEHGLTDEVINSTDVMLWWGHTAHGEVKDDIVDKVFYRIQRGMGLIVLHSGHASKIFQKITGTRSAELKWREDGDIERLWVIDHNHPITQGIGDYIELPEEEVYGETFEIPTPDELLFISWFEGGEVFRSGVTYRRGNGKVFYFRPGHESVPTYHDPKILRVIENAVKWAAPLGYPDYPTGYVRPLSPVGGKIIK